MVGAASCAGFCTGERDGGVTVGVGARAGAEAYVDCMCSGRPDFRTAFLVSASWRPSRVSQCRAVKAVRVGISFFGE